MGCEAYAHSTVWGCPDTNKSCKDLLYFVLRYSILIRVSEPKFVTSWARCRILYLLIKNILLSVLFIRIYLIVNCYFLILDLYFTAQHYTCVQFMQMNQFHPLLYIVYYMIEISQKKTKIYKVETIIGKLSSTGVYETRGCPLFRIKFLWYFNLA